MIYDESKSGTRKTCLGFTIYFHKKILVLDRFFCVSVVMIKESLRPVSESQSLFTRNCWLETGCFSLLLKMASDEDQVVSGGFCEKYRHSDFLYSKNDQYKIVDLHFLKKTTYRKISNN